MGKNSKPKVCFVCSCGGHFMELMQLLPLVQGKRYYIVTEKNIASTEAVKKHPHHYLVQQEREGISFLFKFGWNIFLSFIYFVMEKLPLQIRMEYFPFIHLFCDGKTDNRNHYGCRSVLSYLSVRTAVQATDYLCGKLCQAGQ